MKSWPGRAVLTDMLVREMNTARMVTQNRKRELILVMVIRGRRRPEPSRKCPRIN